jgi:hypothetical protein
MKITLVFREDEMKSIENSVSKYFGSKKPKTKKELKRLLEMFVSTFTNKGFDAVEDGREYIEVQ